jgi:Uma2 family endonuclease
MRPERPYLRPPKPLVFPTGKPVPEGADHKLKLYDLWLSVRRAYPEGCLTSSDQFLYFDPTDPKKCLAPDFAIRLGAPPELLKSWKIWEKGAPHVAVEIVSDWDRSTTRLKETLERYRQAGVLELVRLDPENRKAPIRLWDAFSGDLVERGLAHPEALRCDALGLYWCVQQDPKLGLTLRLSLTSDGSSILPTPEEAALAEKDAALAEKETAFAERQAALAEKDAVLAEKQVALARIAELEAEIAGRRST